MVERVEQFCPNCGAERVVEYDGNHVVSVEWVSHGNPVCDHYWAEYPLEEEQYDGPR